jgi:hypothetical protein
MTLHDAQGSKHFVSKTLQVQKAVLPPKIFPEAAGLLNHCNNAACVFS